MRESTLPSLFRNRHNTGAATITRGRILTPSTTEVDGCILATSATVGFCGVSVEDMQGSTFGKALTRSVQIGGKALLVPGGPISIGDNLTSDSTGRAITSTVSGQTIIGRAECAAAGALTTFDPNNCVEVELYQNMVSASGAMQCLYLDLGYAKLTTAAISQIFSLGVIPAGSWVVGYQVIPVALMAKASQTFALTLGYSGATTYIAAALNVGTGGTITTPQEAAVSKSIVADQTIIATMTTNTGTVDSSTAGETKIRIFYFTPTVITVTLP
jgi:hypothetical protein